MKRLIFFLNAIHVVSVMCAKDFRKFVQDDITIGDGAERVSMKREYEIYSKVTGNRVQVRSRKVDANGAAGSKYVKMEISSVSFGGVITIRGVASRRYICINKRGKLVTKKKARGKSCHFLEAMGENYFDTFTSVRRPEWFLAFHKNGRPKRGTKTSQGQAEIMFLTFLMRPKHERALLSTSSPSALDDETWKALEERIRSQFLSNPSLGMDKQSILLGERVQKTPKITDPPEIRSELETRRQIVLKMSANKGITNAESKKKKKNRRRKSKIVKTNSRLVADNSSLKISKTLRSSAATAPLLRSPPSGGELQRTESTLRGETPRRKGTRRSKNQRSRSTLDST